jgi:site-specific recombinase XerD
MAKTLPLRESIDKYMKFMEFVQSSSPLTLRHYLLDLHQVFEADKGSGFPEKAFTEVDLLAFVREAFNRWAGLSLASRNRKGATLKSFFSWAFREGLLETDLAFHVTCPRVPRKLPHFLSVDEVLSVLRSFDRSFNSAERPLLKEKTLFLLLYGGGLRISEACDLQWSQVKMDQKVLRVIGKGSKERLIAIPAMAMATLKTWKKESPFDKFVFGEEALNTRTAYEMIRQSGKRAGLLKPLHPHALRHSFATHLLSSGANLRTLQELLGHESLTATEKYTHLGIDQLARTMESMHPLGKKSS